MHSLTHVHIALDGSDLAAERFDGPSAYAGELLPRLSRVLIGRGHAVVTYAPGPITGAVIAGEVRVVPGSPFWTQRVLPRALWRERPDVLFLPIQMLPLFRRRTMATVAVVHDLEFLRYPETYTPFNRLLLRFFTRRAVRDASRLIVVSQYTKDDVVRVYGRRPEDMTVVHHGVDHERFGHGASAMGHGQAVRKRYRLPERFVLFVGALQPRKNVSGLLDVFERLPVLGVPGVGLVLVSGGGWKEGALLRRIKTSPRREHIRLLRRISSDDLPLLYRAAALFVLPSFSEGFGMPVLEAMASGVPVVTANTSSLPEVAGGAALLVDPNDPAAIAETIGRVLRDDGLRSDLVRKGRERAQHFTWDRTAEQTADVIERTRHDTASTIEARPL